MSPRKSLFFVEDDLSFGAVLKSYLEICNFSVTWIDDGKHAFSAFQAGNFDLCLLDVMLPQWTALLSDAISALSIPRSQ